MNRIRAAVRFLFRSLVILTAIGMAGCGNGPVPGAIPSPTLASSPTVVTQAISALPTPTIAPAPPSPVPSSAVWYSPMLGSTDLTRLFAEPESWSATRHKINVFEFFSQNLLASTTCKICNGNTLGALVDVKAFQRLAEWGIPIAADVYVIVPSYCTGDSLVSAGATVVQNVEHNGGSVTFLVMSEPLANGQISEGDKTCGYTIQQAATVTADYVQKLHGQFPNLMIGDVEPYPQYPVADLQAWMLELEKDGASPAFFHLDVDLQALSEGNHDVSADLQTLSAFCKQQGIPFGVILSNGGRQPQSDQEYFEWTTGWARTVAAAIGKPDQLIFQNWQGPKQIPVNLPEADPNIFSMTRLVNETLPLFEADKNTYDWEFNTEGDSEGWEVWYQLTPFQVANGLLVTQSQSNDPYMRSATIAVDASAVSRLEIRMKVSGGDMAQVFFVTDSDSAYDEAKSLRFPVSGDGQFHTYTLDMSTVPLWKDTVTQIRLDPMETPGSIEIDYIQLARP
jgi:hypothetical protein